MKPKKKRGRAGRPTGGHALNAGIVVDAAAQLIDREGLAQFSMRRLGQALGVEAMALYNHWDDKDAILDAIASVMLSRVPVPRSKGAWRKRIKDLCGGVRQVALEHPNLFRLAMTRPVIPTVGLPLIESALAAWADAGLSPRAQAIAYRTCFLYVRGYCLWEIDESPLARKLDLGKVPAFIEECPRIAVAKPWIFSPNLDHQFDAGLDAIIRGLVQEK